MSPSHVNRYVTAIVGRQETHETNLNDWLGFASEGMACWRPSNAGLLNAYDLAAGAQG